MAASRQDFDWLCNADLSGVSSCYYNSAWQKRPITYNVRTRVFDTSMSPPHAPLDTGVAIVFVAFVILASKVSHRGFTQNMIDGDRCHVRSMIPNLLLRVPYKRRVRPLTLGSEWYVRQPMSLFDHACPVSNEYYTQKLTKHHSGCCMSLTFFVFLRTYMLPSCHGHYNSFSLSPVFILAV